MKRDSSDGQMSLIPENTTEISKGDLLEYRLKRLLFHMGNYAQTNIILKADTQEPCEVITDFDVLGIAFLNDFSSHTTWADCKSGKADVLKHITWINGVKNNNDISNVIFIKKGVRKSSKEYAHKLGIKVFDFDMIQELETKFEISHDDWSGNYDYRFLREQAKVFSKITIPDNKHYKNIIAFYNSAYWSSDPYTQIKKSLSGIKQLLGFYIMPLSLEEKKSIKWMISSFISLFLLATYKICGQTFYYNNNDKKEAIANGLMSGRIPVAKQKEIRNISIKMATEMIRQRIPDFDGSVFDHISEVTPPSYFEAYYNLVLRISNQPLLWNDVLRTFEYCLIEYDLKGQQIGLNSKSYIRDPDLIVCYKTVLHFLRDAVDLPKEMFHTILELTISS